MDKKEVLRKRLMMVFKKTSCPEWIQTETIMSKNNNAKTIALKGMKEAPPKAYWKLLKPKSAVVV